MKPVIPQLTLVCVDCTPKQHLAINAMARSLDEIQPAKALLITSQPTRTEEWFEAIKIPHIDSLEAYSRFMIRELHKYINTSHALVIQSDGYCLNGQAWRDEWLQFDYMGAPFNPSGTIGNGGFSLRSKRLLEICSQLPEGQDHPEDAAISIHYRKILEGLKLKFGYKVESERFSFEGRSWDSKEWQGIPNQWNGQFGFHSLLSVLPKDKKPCSVFHHSGDAGDVVYSLATMAALGGGALFLSPDCKFPYPLPPRWTRTGGEASFMDNLRPLIEAQPYVDRCSYTHGTPFSTDYDLNRFRLPWKNRSALDTESIFALHQRAFGTTWPEDAPWLSVSEPVTIPGKPIVVNRTPRYHNDNCDWYNLVQQYGDRMIFIGTEQEAKVFEGFAPPKPPVKWYPTKDALEMARVIAGAKLFIGNQSLALAIAHGLGQKAIIEEWPLNPNCRLKRETALPWNKGVPEIPKEWLA